MADNKDNSSGANVTPAAESPQIPQEEPLPAIEEVVTRDVVESIVKKYNPDMELKDFTAKVATEAGDNYMSIIYSVKIEMKSRKTGETDSIAVMLKTMPLNAIRIQLINDCNAFTKEIQMYENVFPDFIAFQESKGLTGDDVFRGFPLCYATFNDGKSDYLALQDLRPLNYKIANRQLGLDEEHCQVILKNLARYHAISFAMFGGDGQKILEKYPFLVEKMFVEEEKIQDAHKIYTSETYKSHADMLRGEGLEKEGDLLESVYSENYWGVMHRLCGPNSKWATIGHGDCWTNNFLFQIDEETKKPKNLSFIDFQLTRCCSRAIDLGYFFHSSPIFELYLSKEEDFLRLYHEEFLAFVTKLGISPSEHDLTWENWQNEYAEYRFYGVAMGLMLAPIISADSADVPDMEGLADDIFQPGKTQELFGEMMKNSLVTKKIKMLTQKHLPRCKGFETA